MKYERFQALREEKSWTQTHVACLLNIAQRTYSHYENGTRSIPLDLLCALADLYDVSTDYLLNRTDIRTSYSPERNANRPASTLNPPPKT